MIILLVLAFGSIALYEAPKLIKKKYWYELVIFSVLLLATFILSLLQAVGIKLPDFSKWMKYIVKFFFK